MGVSVEIDMLMLKFTSKSKETEMIQTILKKKKILRLDFKTWF